MNVLKKELQAALEALATFDFDKGDIRSGNSVFSNIKVEARENNFFVAYVKKNERTQSELQFECFVDCEDFQIIDAKGSEVAQRFCDDLEGLLGKLYEISGDQIAAQMRDLAASFEEPAQEDQPVQAEGFAENVAAELRAAMEEVDMARGAKPKQEEEGFELVEAPSRTPSPSEDFVQVKQEEPKLSHRQ